VAHIDHRLDREPRRNVGRSAAVLRAGSDAWISGSYDPKPSRLLGTAQAKPWARVARGTDGDALFTNRHSPSIPNPEK